MTFGKVYNIIFLLMKKLLTIVLCKHTGEGLTAPKEDIELLFADESQANDSPKALYELIKQAKGKYTVIADTDLTFAQTEEFTGVAEECNTDILAFDGGYALKTSVLKGVPSKLYSDRYGAEIYAAFDSKTITAVALKPFNFTVQHAQYCEEDKQILTETLEEFKKSKAKLPKPVYTFIFDILCARLETFYICAMIALFRKEIYAEELVEFDRKLKENIVLYLALEKRFTLAKLAKLREKNFKISFLQYNKFRKKVKK